MPISSWRSRHRAIDREAGVVACDGPRSHIACVGLVGSRRCNSSAGESSAQVVELHGGAVSVSSEGHGRGGMFAFRLPLTTAEQPGGYDGSPALGEACRWSTTSRRSLCRWPGFCAWTATTSTLALAAPNHFSSQGIAAPTSCCSTSDARHGRIRRGAQIARRPGLWHARPCHRHDREGPGRGPSAHERGLIR